jgi:N6-adenosine-specific RNA methylase IME4
MTPTADSGTPVEGLSPPYRTIVADPPWQYPEGFNTVSRTPGKWQGPIIHDKPLPYPSMSVEDICSLPVAVLADRNCRLFLWTTNRYLPAAPDVMAAWGFAYRQTLTWHKLDGIGGSIAPNSEFLLVGVKGKPPRLGRASASVHAHAQAKSHSTKPKLFGDLIERVSPGPYVELFARSPRLGWDHWGHGYESDPRLQSQVVFGSPEVDALIGGGGIADRVMKPSPNDGSGIVELGGAIGRHATTACKQGQHDLCPDDDCDCRCHE